MLLLLLLLLWLLLLLLLLLPLLLLQLRYGFTILLIVPIHSLSIRVYGLPAAVNALIMQVPEQVPAHNHQEGEEGKKQDHSL